MFIEDIEPTVLRSFFFGGLPILVARHLKTTDDLFDCRSSPRTESLVAAAVQKAERIMRDIDNVFSG
jgi:hypothetical protein